MTCRELEIIEEQVIGVGVLLWNAYGKVVDIGDRRVKHREHYVLPP